MKTSNLPKIFATIFPLLFVSPVAAIAAERFSVESNEIKSGKMIAIEQVFSGFGCTGKNISPSLKWKNAPQGTKSFAVTMYDPDAPTGSGWWHWMIYNIPADITSLELGAGSEDGKLLPKGAVQVKTDFGKPGYGGPCPPVGHGKHRYQFKVFALKDFLKIEDGSSPALVGFNINGNKLGVAELNAVFSR